MSETIRICVDQPPVEFVKGGATLAKFDFYSLEQAIDDAYMKQKTNPEVNAVILIREWMIANGLPSDINVVHVDRWLTAYLKAVDSEAKKENGPSN